MQNIHCHSSSKRFFLKSLGILFCLVLFYSVFVVTFAYFNRENTYVTVLCHDVVSCDPLCTVIYRECPRDVTTTPHDYV